ncbi:hypothetical protein ACGFIV_32290 [Sphaerisporangium sp. NPDC049003]|uniref:hypothetical protein n=1 Tax=Sphaerisporangium sp. NPDC049003 TaxID=3364517 RepID=UPI00371488E7
MDQFTLEIPASVRSHFVVATDLNVSRPAHLVAGRLVRLHAEGHPLAADALALLRSSKVEVETVPAAESGWREELADLAGPDHQVQVLTACLFHQIITVAAPTGQQPRTAQLSRMIARVLAANTRGVLADMAAHHIVPDAHHLDQENEVFHAADHWMTVFLTQDDSTGETLKAETWGLSRFGLPELCTRGFPPDVSMTAVNLLRGLIMQLLDEHWTHLATPSTGPARILATSRAFDTTWIYRYHGLTPARTRTLAIQLRPLPGSPTADLEILPPEPMQLRTARWWRNHSTLTIPPLDH